MAAIEIESLKLKYGTHTAVDDLSLVIEEGSRFGLLGPNGAGKSSTINCIAGLLEPSSGKISVMGVDVSSSPDKVRQMVGLVPQELALYSELSVLENLRIFASMMGLRGQKRRERVSWGLDLAQLRAKAKSKVQHLSGGMKRRLNLACSLLHEPAVIICDEPTTGVDPQSRNHIFETIRELQNTGATVLYTTHYMEEVEALCEEVAIIDRGKIIAHDELEVLLGEPSLKGSSHFILECGQSRKAEELLRALKEAGIDPKRVQEKPRTLEEVFLDLTGRGLRESE